MKTDYITLGATPCDEPCAQVGSPDYYEKAMVECRRYRDLLLKRFGEPPEGARFGIKSFPHDFGSYHEVVVVFEIENEKAKEYAYNVEANLPARWEE